MKKRCAEEEVIKVIKEGEAAAKADDFFRQHIVSTGTVTSGGVSAAGSKSTRPSGLKTLKQRIISSRSY